MNITELNTRDASNIPQPCDLCDPFTGARLEDADGAPVRVWVYGMQSDAARNAVRAVERKFGKADSRSAADSERAGAEYLADITQGWSGNLEDDNGPIQYSRDAAVKLYLEQDWIARQVMDFASRLSNYDPKR